MKLYFILFALCLAVQSISCEETKKKTHYDINNSDDHVFVVQLIFKKLNLLLNETAAISTRLDDMNMRFAAMDKRVDGISKDLANFKTEISNKVRDQEDVVRTLMKMSRDFNYRLDVLNQRDDVSSQDYSKFKTDISKTLQDRHDVFRKELNQRVDEINQLLKKSTTDIAVFKTDITKTVTDQNISLGKVMNETLQYHDRQQEQIKTLWENGSMKKSNDWSVILRRQDGSVDFNRNWADYKKGFGNTEGEFFIGLEPLHKMTSNGLKHEMIITLEHFDKHKTYAKYDNIIIGSENEQYALKELGKHTGDADDSLRHHEGEKFTTKDRDNDNSASENCAQTYSGPWWFYKCNPSSQLFGPYNAKRLGQRMRWSLNRLYELKYVEVKIRQT